jgi:hypothetical protein
LISQGAVFTDRAGQLHGFVLRGGRRSTDAEGLSDPMPR